MTNLLKKSMSFAFALAFIMGIIINLPSLVYADSNEENVSYHKIHNSAFEVDVNVKDGVDISEKSITAILANVNKSDRGNVTIVLVKKILPKKTKNEDKSILIMDRGSSFYYTKHIEDDSYITNKKYLTVDTLVEETSSGLDAYAIIVPIGNEKVKGTLYLQKYRNGYWSTVKKLKFTGMGFTDVCKSYNASSGKYRTKVSVKVGGEHITMYSNSKKIN